MDMDWMQPGNNSNILHPNRKIGQKKGKEREKKRSAQKKSSNPQPFHRYGLVYHSRFGRREYSHPNSIVLIQEKEGLVGRARRRAREESSRRAMQLQRQQTEDAEAEKENKELATKATEGELD
jgi:hypothetical protein